MKNRINILCAMLRVFVCVAIFFSVIQFMHDINLLQTALLKLGVANIVFISIFCITVGVGFQLSMCFGWNDDIPMELFLIAGLFTLWHIVLQVAITIGVELSSCKCTSLHDGIMAVTSWKRIYYAVGMFLLVCSAYLGRKNVVNTRF